MAGDHCCDKNRYQGNTPEEEPDIADNQAWGPLLRQDNGIKTDLIALAWRRLRMSVGMTGRGMSFKHLRKTASQLVRDLAGKELSEAFLCHSDRTTDRYYNKFSDWSAMADALDRVRKKLRPMFDAAKG